MDEIRKHMRRITKMAQTYTAKALQDIDLSPSQMQALRIISFHDNISQQELASHLGIDKAAVARIITALEEKGYISRCTDPSDGRVKRVTATEAGQVMKDKIISGEADFFQHIFRLSRPEDMEVFFRVLEDAFRQAQAVRKNGFILEEGQKPCT